MQDVGIDQSPDIPNLLARVLDEGVHRLVRRGLDRGYVGVTEETRSPRGKMRVEIMAKQQTLLRGAAVCDVDELTPNIIHNQILRATLLNLATCVDVDRKLRHQLAQTARRMINIDTIRLTADLFHRVQLSRNTAQYAFLIRVCELIFHSLMPDEQGSNLRFYNLLDDEVRMAALFEDFLRNFYRAELQGYSVNSEVMQWDAASERDGDLSFLPVMKTDITFRSGSRVVVADAKYYRDALAGGRYGKRAHAPHLYQISTYLAHLKRREPNRDISGLLIYPADGKSIRLSYTLLDMPIRIVTVDLAREWRELHKELTDLIL